MNQNKTPDIELKELILKTIAYHKSELQKYEGILNTINNSTVSLGRANATGNQQNKPRMVSPNSFAGKVLSCFKDTPYTSRELHDLFNKMNGKDSPFNSFSSQLSTLANKSGVLKKHVFEFNPMEHKYYYGRSEWFDGNTLKKEYLDKINEKLNGENFSFSLDDL